MNLANLKLVLMLLVASALHKVSANPTTLTVDVDSSRDQAAMAAGRVYIDVNGDGVYNAETDRVAQSVVVSDGYQSVRTAADGSYKILLRRASRFLWVCVPADCNAPQFYFEINSAQTAQADFPLSPIEQSTTSTHIAHLSDADITSEKDRADLASLFQQIEQSYPKPALIILTGDSVRTGKSAALFSLLKSAMEATSVPIVTTAGDLDTSNGSFLEYQNALGPLWFSRDVGNYHIQFCPARQTGEELRDLHAWMEQDRKLADGRKVIVFQHQEPEANSPMLKWGDLTAVGYGHWRGNRLETNAKGVAYISQAPALMGGLDCNPAGYRLWELGADAVTTTFHPMESDSKECRIIYPSQTFTGPQRIMANVRDTRGVVKEVRFRAINAINQIVTQGDLKQIGPSTWAAPLELAGLSGQIQLRVRATNAEGEQWEGSGTTLVAAPTESVVKPSNNWDQFMGSAQHTGRAPQLTPPLQLTWVAPTHGSCGIGSPIVYQGKVHIPVADRDNLMAQGIMGFDAATGKQTGYARTDSSVVHTPAVVDDLTDGPGTGFVVTMAGKLVQWNLATGQINSEGTLSEDGRQRWLMSAPSVQGKITVAGNSGSLLALNSQLGERRWVNKFAGSDWMPSFNSPTLAGPVVIQGGVGLGTKSGPVSIYGLAASDGRLAWTIPGPGVAGSVSAREGMGWFIDVKGVLHTFSADSGRVTGQLNLDAGWTVSTPAIGNGHIVVASARGAVHGIDPTTMQVAWTYQAEPSQWRMAPLHKGTDSVFSSPVIAGDTIYLGCGNGNLVALRASDGRVLWQHDLGTPILSTPAVSGNALFVAGWDGNVYCFASLHTPTIGASN